MGESVERSRRTWATKLGGRPLRSFQFGSKQAVLSCNCWREMLQVGDWRSTYLVADWRSAKRVKCTGRVVTVSFFCVEPLLRRCFKTTGSQCPSRIGPVSMSTKHWNGVLNLYSMASRHSSLRKLGTFTGSNLCTHRFFSHLSTEGLPLSMWKRGIRIPPRPLNAQSEDMFFDRNL